MKVKRNATRIGRASRRGRDVSIPLSRGRIEPGSPGDVITDSPVERTNVSHIQRSRRTHPTVAVMIEAQRSDRLTPPDPRLDRTFMESGIMSKSRQAMPKRKKHSDGTRPYLVP